MPLYTPDRTRPNPLRDPLPTEVKRVRRWLAQQGLQRAEAILARPQQLVVPALDMQRMQDTYHPEHGSRPRLLTGTFRVPLDCPQALFAQLAQAAARVFVQAMDKQGYDLAGPPKVFPGVYPARDLLSGLVLLGEREFFVQAPFAYRQPKPVRLELPAEMREAFTVGQGAS